MEASSFLVEFTADESYHRPTWGTAACATLTDEGQVPGAAPQAPRDSTDQVLGLP